jgi:competence protein ComEC
MINWREIPFVRLLAAFVAGILVAIYWNYEIPGIIVAIVSLLILMVAAKQLKGLYRFRWLFGVLLNLLLVLTGYLVTWKHHELNAPDHFSKIIRSPDNIVIGQVTEVPDKKEDWIKIRLQVEGVGTSPDSLQHCTGNILLYLERDSAAEWITYGDLLSFNGKISGVEPPKNPHSFDYRRYLHFQNIHHQAFVRDGQWRLLEHGHGNPLYTAAVQWQQHFYQTLQKHMGEDDAVLAVGSALILGYRGEMPEDILTSYSDTGAMHVLSVSGLHVGIVAMLLNFLLGRVQWHSPYWKLLKLLILLGAIWAFALVTGASPSVLRATVMFSMFSIGISKQRHINFYNTLAASAFILLFYDPYWLMSVSFQLSYLAILGIVYFVPKIERLWLIENKIGHYIWQMNCVSLGATLMTIPFTLYYFHQFPTYFWLSSLVLVPLAGFDLFFGLLLLPVEAIWPSMAVWVGKALYGCIWLGNEALFFIQRLPGALIDGIWIGSWTVLLLFLLLTSGMAAISFKKFKWILAGLGLLLMVSAGYAFKTIPQAINLKLVVYHVYKHTAIDFMDGNRVYSLRDGALDEKSLSFAAEGNRFANGVGEVINFSLEDTLTHTLDTWFFQDGFIQFYETRLGIIDYKPAPVIGEKVKLDYLLLRGSPKVDMEALTATFDFKTVIFDASNKKWQVEQWKKQCEQLGIVFFDINEQGAFILNLQSVGSPKNNLPGWYRVLLQ